MCILSLTTVCSPSKLPASGMLCHTTPSQDIHSSPSWPPQSVEVHHQLRDHLRLGWGQHCHQGAEALHSGEDVNLRPCRALRSFASPSFWRAQNSGSSSPISTNFHCLILVANFAGIGGIPSPIYAPPIGGFVPAPAGGRKLVSAIAGAIPLIRYYKAAP